MSEWWSSWTSLSSSLPITPTITRAVSTASIVITIEAEEQCERTPLLASQWHSGYQSTTTPTINRNQQYHYQNSSYGGGNLEDNRNMRRYSPTAASKFPLRNYYRRSRSHRYRHRYDSYGSEYSGGSNSSNTSTYYYEAKPHLCDVRLFAIFFILIAGFTIATYLLIAETRLPTNGFILDLVTYDIWSKLALPLTGLLNNSNVSNVLILHTGGESCYSQKICNRLLNQMQKNWTAQNPYEMPYNFLVADDGQTYEVRGWNHLSGIVTDIPQNTSIVIGFLGNYTRITPNSITLQSALSLIKESVRRKKLQQNYQIFGIRNITAHKNDAEALFNKINQWAHFEKLINIF